MPRWDQKGGLSVLTIISDHNNYQTFRIGVEVFLGAVASIAPAGGAGCMSFSSFLLIFLIFAAHHLQKHKMVTLKNRQPAPLDYMHCPITIPPRGACTLHLAAPPAPG